MSTTCMEIVRRFFITLSIISLLIGSTTFAQEIPKEIQAILDKDSASWTDKEAEQVAPYMVPSLLAQPEMPQGAVDCFDYYKFGSVQADLSTVVSETVPGIPLTFTGTLKNENPYPVVNGSLWVKIFKTDGQKEEQIRANGYPLIAFFEAGKDIQIAGNGSIPYTFEWQVPMGAEGGDYSAGFFFVTDNRFNLLGLTFTDDVLGNKTSFSIEDDTNTPVTFDKHKVTLNGNRYNFAAVSPRFTKDEPVTISVPVVNPSTEPRTVSLTYTLYNWDGLRSDHLMDTKTEVVTLNPGEQKSFSYTADSYSGTVSYLVATLEDGDATSIINPRFARNDVSEVRLNYPSLFSFPIEGGKEQTIFSCMHGTSESFPIVPDNTLTMTLTDLESNKVIHTYVYEGGITGAMMGVKDTFTPGRSYGKVKLTTTLAHAGETIDEVSQVYDCEALGVTCPSNSIFTSLDEGFGSPHILFYVFVSLAALAVLFFIGERYRREKDRHTMKMPTMPLVLLFTILTTVTFGVSSAEANNDSWSSGNISTYLMYFADCGGAVGCGGAARWYPGLHNFNVTVNHEAQIRSNGTLLDDTNGPAQVSVGDMITIQTPQGSISWNGTGYTSDTPIGRWIPGAEAPATIDLVGDLTTDNLPYPQFGPIAGSYGVFDLYMPLSVNPPTITYTYTGSTAQLDCNADGVPDATPSGSSCRVLSTGSINAQVRYTNMYGRFYYKYTYYPRVAGITPLNYYNRIPMTALPSRCANPWQLGANPWQLGCNALWGPQPPYTLNIPSRSISFALTASISNNAPSIPDIRGSQAVYGGSTHTYTIESTDSDSPQIRYQMNWSTANNSTAVHQCVQPNCMSTVAENTEQAVSHNWPIVGAPTTYYVRAQAVDDKGTPSGWSAPYQVVVTPPPKPTVSTLPADQVQVTQLRLNGTTNPNGFDTTAQFRWGLNNVSCSALPNTIAVPATFTGNNVQPFSANLSGLAAHTTYYYCAVGINANGTTEGVVRSSITLNTPPVVDITAPGNNLTFTFGQPITFTGTVTNPDVDGDPVTYSWRRGSCVGTLMHNDRLSFDTSSLPPGTYDICLRAQDGFGGIGDDTVRVTIIEKKGSINAPDCTIPPGQRECTSTITWTSENLSSVRILENSTQFDTAANNLTGVTRTLTNGTYTYTIYEGSTPIASDSMTAQCAVGSTADPVTGVCSGSTPAAPVLSFTANPTTVSAGTPTQLEWTVNGGVDACFARSTDPALSAWSGFKPFSGTQRQDVIPTQDTTFFLECFFQGVSSGEEDERVTITANNTKSASISATPCVISAGSASCNTLVTWTSTNLVNPSIQKDGNQFSTQPNSPAGGQIQTVAISAQPMIPQITFSVFDTVRINDNQITPTCATGASWNGTICTGAPVVPGGTPTLKASPRIVEEGEDTTLTWFTNGTPETNCTLTGGAFGTGGVTVPDGGGDQFNGSLSTPVYANTTYNILCPASATAAAKVEIIPRYFPS